VTNDSLSLSLSPLYTKNSLARDATFVPNPPDPRWLDALAILVDPWGWSRWTEQRKSDHRRPRSSKSSYRKLKFRRDLFAIHLLRLRFSFEDSDCPSRNAGESSFFETRKQLWFAGANRELQNSWNPNQNLSAHDYDYKIRELKLIFVETSHSKNLENVEHLERL